VFTTTKRTLFATIAAAATITALAGCASTPGSDPDAPEDVTIGFSFWGNDVRADMYNQAIAEFERQHPGIDVSIQFLAPTDYWERKQVEASGGGLTDVVTMDLAYLRQYSENGVLLDLEPYLGTTIRTDGLDPQVLGAGTVDGVTTALPLSTNAWGMFLNTTILDELGVAAFETGTWSDYFTWMGEVRTAADAAGVDVWGGVDPTTRFTNFELYLRAQGSHLFADDGTPGFDEDDLREFWGLATSGRETGAIVPQQRAEEIVPLTAFDAAISASDTTWDNSGSGFLGNLGEGYEIALIAPPIDVAGGKDLYLKASQMYSIASTSDHPEEAAALIDFLINSPESGEIFGSNRGLPASATARAAADLDAVSEMIAAYETSLGDRLGEAPPVPVVGYGTLHEKFRVLGEELNFGTLTLDEAVAQFFTEMDVVLHD